MEMSENMFPASDGWVQDGVTYGLALIKGSIVDKAEKIGTWGTKEFIIFRDERNMVKKRLSSSVKKSVRQTLRKNALKSKRPILSSDEDEVSEAATSRKPFIHLDSLSINDVTTLDIVKQHHDVENPVVGLFHSLKLDDKNKNKLQLVTADISLKELNDRLELPTVLEDPMVGSFKICRMGYTFDGDNVVLKKAIKPEDDNIEFFKLDIRTTYQAQLITQNFCADCKTGMNLEYLEPFVMEMTSTSQLSQPFLEVLNKGCGEIDDRPCRFVSVEPVVGENPLYGFNKFSDNSGWIMQSVDDAFDDTSDVDPITLELLKEDIKVVQALMHYSLFKSKGEFLLCDVQGARVFEDASSHLQLVDACLLTKDTSALDTGPSTPNIGLTAEAMTRFKRFHKCETLCKELKLPSLKASSKKPPKRSKRRA